MPRVHPAEPRRKEYLDLAADQFLARVSEHPIGLGVGKRDASIRPHDDHGIRGRFQQVVEHGVDALLIGGKIPDDFDEAGQHTGLIPYRADRYSGAKAAPPLAYSPALELATVRLLCSGQLTLGRPGIPVRVDVEHRRGPPQNLSVRVPQHGLGSCAPVHNHTR